MREKEIEKVKEVEILSKVCIYGLESGKTALVLRLVKGYFLSCPRPTIGADFVIKVFNNVRLQVWDISGKEHNQLERIFSGSSSFIFTFDPTKKLDDQKVKFLNMLTLIQSLLENKIDNTIDNTIDVKKYFGIYVVVTKADLLNESRKKDIDDFYDFVKVESEKAENSSLKIHPKPYITSAKEDRGVQDLFQEITNDAKKLASQSDSEKQAQVSSQNNLLKPDSKEATKEMTIWGKITGGMTTREKIGVGAAIALLVGIGLMIATATHGLGLIPFLFPILGKFSIATTAASTIAANGLFGTVATGASEFLLGVMYKCAPQKMSNCFFNMQDKQKQLSSGTPTLGNSTI